EDGWTTLQFIQASGEEGSTLRIRIEEVEQLTVCLQRDVVQRAERTRRKQGITCAPQHARRMTLCLREARHERGLANARLAAHQNDAPAAACGFLQRVIQYFQNRCAFDQDHCSWGTTKLKGLQRA